jgi:hypothetical protein
MDVVSRMVVEAEQAITGSDNVKYWFCWEIQSGLRHADCAMEGVVRAEREYKLYGGMGVQGEEDDITERIIGVLGDNGVV